MGWVLAAVLECLGEEDKPVMTVPAGCEDALPALEVFVGGVEAMGPDLEAFGRLCVKVEPDRVLLHIPEATRAWLRWLDNYQYLEDEGVSVAWR